MKARDLSSVKEKTKSPIYALSGVGKPTSLEKTRKVSAQSGSKQRGGFQREDQKVATVVTSSLQRVNDVERHTINLWDRRYWRGPTRE